MSNTVQLTQTVDQREVVDALQKQAQLIDKATQRLDQMGRKGEQSGRQAAKGWGDLGTTLLQAGGGLATVNAAMSIAQRIMREIADQQERLQRGQQAASGTQQTVAQKQRAAAFNFGAENAGLMGQWAREIADKTGAEVGNVFDSLSAGASFRGELPMETVRAAVLAAAEIDPNDAAAIQTQTTAILAQQKQSRGSAADIAGYQMRLKQLSPTITNAEFAQNVAPAVADLMSLGATDSEAGGLLAYLGGGMNDVTGRETRTAAITLSNQLKRIVPHEQSLTAQIQAIQSNPQLQRELLGAMDKTYGQSLDPATRKSILEGNISDIPKAQLTGEAKAMASYVALLSDPKAFDKFQQFAQAAGQVQGSDKFFQEQVAAINALPEQQAQAQRNQMAGQVQQVELQNPGALSADVRTQFDRVVEQYGLQLRQPGSALKAKPEEDLIAAAGYTPEAVDDITAREKFLRRRADAATAGGEFVKAEQLTKLADQFAKTAEIVAKLEQTIAQQNQLQAEANQKLGENTDATAQNTRQNQANPVDGQQRGTP